jgi:hypothetical protein
MKRSSLVLPSACDEEEGKRPSPRSKEARRRTHTFRKQEASGEKMTALGKRHRACSQLAIHKRDSQLTTEGKQTQDQLK